MKNTIDIKSLVVGAALGVLAVLAVGAGSLPTPGNGHYEILASDSYIFKIDTTTGQVWRTFVGNENKEFMSGNAGK